MTAIKSVSYGTSLGILVANLGRKMRAKVN
jgi:hypothetical protein